MRSRALVAGLALLALPVHAAITVVQETGNNAVGQSVSKAFASNVTAGNLVTWSGMAYKPGNDAFVASDCNQSAGTATLGTITADKIAHVATTGTSDYADAVICSAIVTGSGSLTMRINGAIASSELLLGIAEYHASGGWDASAATRVEATNSATLATNDSDAASAGSVTTAGGALILGALDVNQNSTETFTPGGSFVTVYDHGDATQNSGSAMRQIVASGSTVSADWSFTPGSNDGWAAVVVAYKESAPPPPTLSSPTPSGTLGTTTTATIGATTDQSSGTFYAVVDTDSLTGITAAQIKAAQDAGGGAVVASCNATVSTTSPSCGVTALAAGTTYNYAVVQNNTNGDSNVPTVGTFTTAAASPATLSSPTPSGTLGTTTTATIGATTDDSSGTTFYAVVDDAGGISGITAAQIKAGHDSGGASAIASCNAAVSTSMPSCGVTGLTAATGYSYAAVQANAGGDSNVVTGTFTTASGGGGGTAVPVFLHHYDQQASQ